MLSVENSSQGYPNRKVIVKMLRLASVCLAASALLVSADAFAASKKPAKPVPRDVRLECRFKLAAEAAAGSVRYEDSKGRQSFAAPLAAKLGGTYKAGDVFDVVVAGFRAGQVTLVAGATELEGQLRLNSKPSVKAEKAFPAGFPLLDAGAAAQIGSNGCTLQKKR
jgi:hypothetical protein